MNIPADVKEEYFALIEERGETDDGFREIINNINAFWEVTESAP